MGGAQPCASRPDLHLVMPVAWETRQAFRVKAGLERHLEKGSCTVCSVHCPVLETQPCPGPRMEPREGPHRRFLLCVSRETHLRPSPLLLGPRPWQGCRAARDVGSDCSGSGDHRPAPVCAQRLIPDPRAATARQGPSSGRSPDQLLPRIPARAPGFRLQRPGFNTGQ